MKKILLSIFVALIVIGAAVFYFISSNLESFIVKAVETAGTEILKTEVSVGDIDLSLRKGSASIKGIEIANPEGYSDNKAISFGEISVGLDVKNKAIDHIIARSLHFRIEGDMQNNNFTAFQKSLGGGETAEAPAETEEEKTETTPSDAQVISINKILIEDVKVMLYQEGQDKPKEVVLETIELLNLKGTPEELGAQIFQQIFSKTFQALAGQELGASVDELKKGFSSMMSGDEEGAKESLKNAENKMKSLFGGMKGGAESTESATETKEDSEDATKDVTSKVSGLFKKFGK